MSGDLIEAGVAAVANAVANGETTAEAVTQTALSRLETRARRCNGVVLVEADPALAQAREVDLARKRGDRLGYLAGVPMAHKDLFYRVGDRLPAARKSVAASCRPLPQLCCRSWTQRAPSTAARSTWRSSL